MLAMTLESCFVDEIGEQRDALRRLHAAQPDKRQPARVQRAIVGGFSNLHHLLALQTEEHHKLAGALHSNRSTGCLFSRLRPGDTMLFCEPARPAAAVSVAVVSAAYRAVSRNLCDAVSHPFRSVGLRLKAAKRIRKRRG